jgi:very-short-patch-repair endonuclease
VVKTRINEVDFLSASARLIVELDGPPHETEERRAHDRRRDAFPRDQGFRVLRSGNDEVLGNPQGAIGVALAPSPALLRRAPSPADGRGEAGDAR